MFPENLATRSQGRQVPFLLGLLVHWSPVPLESRFQHTHRTGSPWFMAPLVRRLTWVLVTNFNRRARCHDLFFFCRHWYRGTRSNRFTSDQALAESQLPTNSRYQGSWVEEGFQFPRCPRWQFLACSMLSMVHRPHWFKVCIDISSNRVPCGQAADVILFARFLFFMARKRTTYTAALGSKPLKVHRPVSCLASLDSLHTERA
jgi:hypothetical protein